jgi:hypothetical protein
MPSLIPMIPLTAIALFSLLQLASQGIGCVLPKMPAISCFQSSVFSVQSEQLKQTNGNQPATFNRRI